MILNERIKELREKKHITLLDVAKQLGVSESTAQRYESTTKGIKTVPYDIIVGYAKIFNVSPSYLMGWEEESKSISHSDKTEELIRKLEMLTEEQQGTVLALIDLLIRGNEDEEV